MVPIATALRDSLRGYNVQSFKHDAIAGLVVSLVALPLAMALSIAVGLPPQHGLYTAIVAGFFVPLLGGSRMQVSGPTAAFVVIVAPIVSDHGLRGLIITTFLAGFILIGLGAAKLGRHIEHMPHAVTTGFTAGIAVVIATLALNDFLGLGIESLSGSYIHKLTLIAQHLPIFYWPEALIGLLSLAAMAGSYRFFPKLPAPLIGVVVGIAIAGVMAAYEIHIATIGNRFSYLLADGNSGHGIPPFLPSFHIPGLDGSALFAWPSVEELRLLIVPALVIAALSALESLLSATVADKMAGTKHQPNAELIGIGVGNIFSALVAGIPATGAIARTATNIHSGARTPLSASLHAVFILIYVLLLAPYLSAIPMASLAALLLFVAYRMSHYEECFSLLKNAPRSDKIVLLSCFGFTVFIDMVAGVTVGVVLAFLFSRLAKAA